MSEKIPNPFKKEWEEFDRAEFKKAIGSILDEIIDCTDEDELDDLVCDLDDEIANLILMLRFKELKDIEVVKLTELSKDKLIELGFSEEDLEDIDEDAVIPLIDVFGFSIADLVDKEPPKKKDKKDWML